MIHEDAFTLRRLEPRDISALHAYRNDPDIVAGLGGFSMGYSFSDLQEWLEAHRNTHNEVLLCIAEPDTDECLGHIGLYNIDHRVRKAELAIMIGAKTYHGRGLGKAVCQRLIDYARQELNLQRIELSLLASNHVAERLYVSLGFEREGVLRRAAYRGGSYVDVILMALIYDPGSA